MKTLEELVKNELIPPLNFKDFDDALSFCYFNDEVSTKKIADDFGFSNVTELKKYIKKNRVMFKTKCLVCDKDIMLKTRGESLCAQHEYWKICGKCGEWTKPLGCEECLKKEANKKEAEWEEKQEIKWVECQPKLRWFHRKLFTCIETGGEKSFQEYCEMAAIKKSMVNYLWRDLQEWGIIFSHNNKWRFNKFAGKVVEGTNAVKSVFDSTRERQVYISLVQQHPTKLVLPNQSLASFIDFNLVKSFLSKEECDYFFKARVDFLLVHPFSLFPLLAIEVQSSYHDDETQKEKDQMKENILKSAQVPFELIYKPEET